MLYSTLSTLLTAILLVSELCFSVTAHAEMYRSPDAKLKADFFIREGRAFFDLSYRNQPLLTAGGLGLEFQTGGVFKSVKFREIRRWRHKSGWIRPIGKSRNVEDWHQGVLFSLNETTGLKRKIFVEVKLFNDAFAFRYRIPRQSGFSSFVITRELTSFRPSPLANAMALELPFQSSYEGFYTTKTMSEWSPGSHIVLPALLKHSDDGPWFALTEAALTDYAGLYLKLGQEGAWNADLAPDLQNPDVKVRGRTPFESPWRVVLVGDHPGRLLESNSIANLNSENAIGETSWIKPGKIHFPWWNGYVYPGLDPHDPDPGRRPGLNTATIQHYIDFCAENGIEYHSFDGFDEAWYGGGVSEPDSHVDVTKSIAALDMPWLLSYARKRGVRPRIWLHWRALAQMPDIEKVFSTYEAWGVEGVMIDFLNRDDQEMVRFHTRLIQLAARHHLTINFHGVWKPTGVDRTYPNLLSHEAVMGAEFDKWLEKGVPPEHEIKAAFVRMLAGSLDVHPGSFRPVGQNEFRPQEIAPQTIGTLARELAHYIVFESGMQMLVDFPESYLAKPQALQFLRMIPASWDETRVLEGDPMSHIVMARRKAESWYVGALSGQAPAEIEWDLSFLGSGQYRAVIFLDNQAPAEQVVVRTSKLKFKMIEAGGLAIRFSPSN